MKRFLIALALCFGFGLPAFAAWPNGGNIFSGGTVPNAIVTLSSITVGGGSSLIASTQPAGLSLQVNNGSITTIYTSSISFVGSTVTIQTNGNLGIGTSSPTQLLTTRTGAAQAAGGVLVVSSGTQVQTQLQANDSSSGFGVAGTISNHALLVQTNNTTRLTVAAAGNVGIGTVAPATLLDVSTGTVGLPSFTSAQLVGVVPGKIGGILYNTTINMVCMATNTAVANGFARIQTPGTGCQ